VDGIALWFDCYFGPAAVDGAESEIALRTGPMDLPTHWHQTVVQLPPAATAALAGEPTVRCSLELARDRVRRRHYNISLEILPP
jgi:hypothetical protein